MAVGEVSIGAVSVLIGADASQLVKETKNAVQQMKALENTTANVVAKLKNAFLAVAGPSALGYMIKQSIDAVSKQKDLAARLDTTVGSVQVMQRAFELSGMSAEEFEKAADRLNKKLGEGSREIKGPVTDAFNSIGLKISDLTKMNVDERFIAISNALEKTGFSASQTADFLGRLGIRGGRLGTLFKDGAANIEEANRQLEKFGLKNTDEQAAMLEAAGDALTVFGLRAKGLGNILATEMSPFIIAAGKAIVDMGMNSQGTQEKIRGLTDSAVEGLGFMLDVLAKIEQTLENVGIKGSDFFKSFSTAGLNPFKDLQKEGENFSRFWDTLKQKISDTGIITFPKSAAEMGDEWRTITDDMATANAKLVVSDEQLKIQTGKKMPSEDLKERIKLVRQLAEDEAKAAADKMQDQRQDNQEGLNPQVDKLSAKEREALEKKLLAFKASLSEEAAAAFIHRQQQLDEAKEFAEKGIVDAQKYAALKLAVEEKFQRDRQKMIWDNITSSYATELQQHEHQFEERMKKLKEYQDTQFMSEDAAAAARNKMVQDYELKKAQIIATSWSSAASIIDSAVSNISQVVGQEGKKGFTIMKAIAMATALVKGYEAAVSAFATGEKTGIPGMGFVMAGIAAAGTAAIIAKLAGVGPTSTGTPTVGGAGGGGIPGEAGAAGQVAANEAPTRSMVVSGFNPREWMKGDAVRDMVQEIVKFQNDGGKVIIT